MLAVTAVVVVPVVSSSSSSFLSLRQLYEGRPSSVDLPASERAPSLPSLRPQACSVVKVLHSRPLFLVCYILVVIYWGPPKILLTTYTTRVRNSVANCSFHVSLFAIIIRLPFVTTFLELPLSYEEKCPFTFINCQFAKRPILKK